MRRSPGANRERLVRRLITHGPTHRAELARDLGTSRATITTLSQQLLDDGVLSPLADDADGSPSRGVTPHRQDLGLRVDRGVIVQVAFHARSTVCALTGLDGRILRWSIDSRSHLETADEWMEAAERQLEEMMLRSEQSPENVAHVHLALNTQVDHRTGQILDSKAAGPWRNVDPAAHVRRWTSAPWSVQNTARQEALAEYLALPTPRPLHMIHVSLAWGIGMGQIFDGRIVTGERGASGELGHYSIDPHGLPCDCGNRGCLAAHAGLGVVLERATTALGRTVDSIDDVSAAALAGHDGCSRILRDTGHSVGTALASVCNLLAPDVIVVGGEIGAASPTLVSAVAQHVGEVALPLTTRHLRILPSRADQDPLAVVTSGHGVLKAKRSIIDGLVTRALGPA